MIRAMLLLAILTGCHSAHYQEASPGRRERDELMERVAASRDAQLEFQDRLARTLSHFQASPLHEEADLTGFLARSHDAVRDIDKRIDRLVSRSTRTFERWEKEIAEIDVKQLRKAETKVLVETQRRYDELMTKLHAARASITPVLQDLEAYARAVRVAETSGDPERPRTSQKLHDDVTSLMALLQASIDEASEYLAAERRS